LSCSIFSFLCIVLYPTKRVGKIEILLVLFMRWMKTCSLGVKQQSLTHSYTKCTGTESSLI
jgi:hypothetical protein